MIIYIDENLPPKLSEGLHILQYPLALREGGDVQVRSVKTVFGEGVKDEIWIPLAGREDACIITQDFNISRIRHQNELCRQHGLGMFYFRFPSKNGLKYWELVEFCIQRWPQILKVAIGEPRPFAYRCPSRGNFEKM